MKAAKVSAPVSRWDSRIDADVVIVGAGIAGLSFALRLTDSLRIVILTKGPLRESNTWYAQGGIAAAVGPDDDPDLHLQDTITAGAGLTDIDAARAMAERGPSAMRGLLRQGTNFDLDGHILALGYEAAHSRRRVLHAGGDATGAEIERTLIARLRLRTHITFLQETIAVDIAYTVLGAAGGVIATGGDRMLRLIAASVTVLANGGAGSGRSRRISQVQSAMGWRWPYVQGSNLPTSSSRSSIRLCSMCQGSLRS